MNTWSKNLELLIKSRTSLIWIKTKEEERLEKILNISSERLNVRRFVRWDCVNGIKGVNQYFSWDSHVKKYLSLMTNQFNSNHSLAKVISLSGIKAS